MFSGAKDPASTSAAEEVRQRNPFVEVRQQHHQQQQQQQHRAAEGICMKNPTRWRPLCDVNMASHSVSEKSPIIKGRKVVKKQDVGPMEIEELQSRTMYPASNNDEILRRIFGDRIAFESLPTATSSPIRKPVGLHNLEFYIDKELDDISLSVPHDSNATGRIGPKKVIFDVATNAGSFVIDRDKLGVSSQSNFSSIRANVCVFKGKWQFELMLGSKGVMQLGWATIHCQFSQEKGVGDTPDSYAYDGNRVRKWNMATFKYGENWLTGDIIGCTIDLDIGSVRFYRNGRDLGEAFNNVRIGPGMAYFPSISLAFSENLVANFGATPMKYPVRGFRPLQDPPHQDLARANKLIGWLNNLLPLMLEEEKVSKRSATRQITPVMSSSSHTQNASLMMIAAHIIHRLGPLLMTMYVTEGCLLSFLVDLNKYVPGSDMGSCLAPRPYIQKLLDLMWALLEDFEIKQCLENLIIGLLTAYRFSPISSDFLSQHKYLALTLAVLRHRKTRLLLLRNVLFDKIKFPIFLHIKPLDNDSLEESVPEVWWEMKEVPIDPDLPSEKQKLAYNNAILRMKKSLHSLESIQVELLKVLLENKENPAGPTTRQIFLGKFREFLKENMTGSRLHPVHLCPLPVTLCFFHRLIQALRFYWDQYALSRDAPAFITSSANAYIPTRVFYDDSVNFFEIQRIGGLLSHLKKALKEDVSQALGIKTSVPTHLTAKDPNTSSSSAPPSPRAGLHHFHHEENLPSTSQLFRVTNERKFSLPNSAHSELVLSTALMLPSSHTSEHPTFTQLVEILDGVVLLYHIAAHKQLAKMCSLRESMQEYVQALEDTEAKISHCNAEDYGPEVKSALLQAKTVFLEKLAEQARHYAWVQAVIYSREKQEDVYWLLQVLLRTLNRASLEGSLLSFVPDYYVEACINSCNALRTYFNPINPSTTLLGYQDALMDVGLFLSSHFADKRVINADIKDTLIQAVASFVCQPATLQALESMPKESRLTMVRALLQPYENRAWAQSNWILVRLWKGCGFGFRYTQPPHMVKRLGPKPQNETNLSSQYHKPCPSILFQKHVAELLIEEPDLAMSFLNSVLNQLNWAFSEFIGMLQEIQNASNRPERVFIDSRQLKICATCYDLALALLRVLEMIVHVCPHLFTDGSNSSSELLLSRLCQLLCQVLNRVTSRSGCFDHVVALEISGLETVDHYPIIAAVTGILIQLIYKGSARSRACATNALLAEPSFQLSSIEFLLGLPERTGRNNGGKRHFSLLNYDEVSTAELHEVEMILQHLAEEQLQIQAVTQLTPEEELCTICYAHQSTAIFNPCGHQSCRACIAHHLMNKSDCFFCKITIETVVDLSGKVLHDLIRKSSTTSST